MPEGAVYVGRPSRWGNPFVVDAATRWDHHSAFASYLVVTVVDRHGQAPGVRFAATDWTDGRALAVDLYRRFKAWKYNIRVDGALDRDLDLRDLRGRDLACWCPLSAPCHADVLLELANQ